MIQLKVALVTPWARKTVTQACQAALNSASVPIERLASASGSWFSVT